MQHISAEFALKK